MDHFQKKKNKKKNRSVLTLHKINNSKKNINGILFTIHTNKLLKLLN